MIAFFAMLAIIRGGDCIAATELIAAKHQGKKKLYCMLVDFFKYRPRLYEYRLAH